jgi:hypothetical protein
MMIESATPDASPVGAVQSRWSVCHGLATATFQR